MPNLHHETQAKIDSHIDQMSEEVVYRCLQMIERWPCNILKEGTTELRFYGKANALRGRKMDGKLWLPDAIDLLHECARIFPIMSIPFLDSGSDRWWNLL